MRPTVVFQRSGVLGIQAIGELFERIAENHESFVGGTVADAQTMPTARRTWVMQSRAVVNDAAARLTPKISELLPEALHTLSRPAMSIKRIETQVSLYHHKCFYDWHKDIDGKYGLGRVLSFVYYMHRMPKQYSGGTLVFDDGFEVEPENDTLIIFSPELRHRVETVYCYSADPLDGRMTINGWIVGEFDKPKEGEAAK